MKEIDIKNTQRHAVIDVGSNTIRTVIYAVDKAAGIAKPLISEREFASIITYVKHRQLNEAGQLQLIKVLKKMSDFCAIANSEAISCFSTASLRDAENLDAVIARVKEETSIEIRPISTAEETFYDYEGLRSLSVAGTGVGLDLGGGSCQLFHYDEAGCHCAGSMKIGCVTLTDEYVDGIFPTKSEAKKIRAKVKRAVRDLSQGVMVPKGTFLYAMGGTARAAARVYAAMQETGAVEKSSVGVQITKDALAEIIDFARHEEKQCIRLLSRVAPARLHTLIPGIIVLRTICKELGAAGLEVVRTGVREGFLWHEILKRDDVMEIPEVFFQRADVPANNVPANDDADESVPAESVPAEPASKE